MVQLKFKTAEERQSSTSLQSAGKVATIVGVGGQIKPTNATRALEQGVCALKVELIRADGTIVDTVCSKNVMIDLRNKTLPLSGLKGLEVFVTQGNKSALNPETNTYEQMFDENGLPIKEEVYSLGYSGGADQSALVLSVTEDDIASVKAASRTISWEDHITI